ncbi:MAG: caspase family protein [Hyphomicrobium aestuarii]|nr:caspase family protein [Hyphomicrobium aestuarii]
MFDLRILRAPKSRQMGAARCWPMLLAVLAAAMALPVSSVNAQRQEEPRTERRVGLVIGIDRYPALPPGAQLTKAVADARAVRDMLRQRLGFDEVVYGENVGLAQTRELMLSFSQKLKPGDVAFVYFAGHGMNVRLGNYLLPSDLPSLREVTTEAQMRLEEESMVERSISEERLRELVTLSGAKLAIMVLDACRNNVFREALAAGGPRTRTLAVNTQIQGARPIERSAGSSPTQFISLYSASPGQRALDSLGPTDQHPNSPFTRVLVERLPTPGQRIHEVLRALRGEVVALAASVGHDQRPAITDEALDDAILVPGGNGGPTMAGATKPNPTPAVPAPGPTVAAAPVVAAPLPAAIAQPSLQRPTRQRPSFEPAATTPSQAPNSSQATAVPVDWAGWRLQIATNTQISSVAAHALSPDGRMIAASYRDRSLKLWSVDSGQQIGAIAGADDVQDALLFSPDGSLLAAHKRRSGAVTVFNTRERTKSFVLTSPVVENVSAMAFSDDGMTLTLRDSRGAVTAFDIASRRERVASPADAAWLSVRRSSGAGLDVRVNSGSLRVYRSTPGSRREARLYHTFVDGAWVGIAEDGVSFTGSSDRVAGMVLAKGADRLPVTREFIAAHYRAGGFSR